jgi:hypothetical protein
VNIGDLKKLIQMTADAAEIAGQRDMYKRLYEEMKADRDLYRDRLLSANPNTQSDIQTETGGK